MKKSHAKERDRQGERGPAHCPGLAAERTLRRVFVLEQLLEVVTFSAR